MSNRAALWERLCAAGLASGEMPERGDAAAPWYVRTMVGVAGWIAAAFLLGFVGAALAFVVRNGPSSVIAGLLLCAAAIAMLLVLSRQEFFSQFALATSLAGQALVVAGLMQMFPHDDAAVYLAIAGFECGLAVLAPYSVHRTWSAFAGALALFLALHEWRATALFPGLAAAGFVLLQRAEMRLVAHASLWQATSAGVALALLAIVPASLVLDGSWLIGQDPRTGGPIWNGYGTLLAGVVLVATAASLVARHGVALGSRGGVAALGGALAIAVAAWPVPGVAAGMVVTVVAFAAGRVAMTGLGLVTTAAALSYYYYSLEVPLLTKAVSLLTLGTVLIVARYAFRRWIGSRGEEAGHA